ncbi:MAG: PDZ domain-containing protein, partial [Planctomycetes bacterium]|nr:PDZ domain-containing protein [Planctomycetota bacterium]
MSNNCTQMRLFITALLHNELDSADSTQTKEHINECNDCKAYFLKIRKLEQFLKSAIPNVEIPSVRNDVMKKIGETEKNNAIRENIMTIRFDCAKCKRHFEAETKHVGKKMKCPKCGTVNVVPSNPTISPKQVRPPSRINDAETGQMPSISKQIADTSSSATPLVGEIPTVKEVRRIASDIQASRKAPRRSNVQRSKPRRIQSEPGRMRKPRRSPEYRVNATGQQLSADKNSQKKKYVIIGSSAFGFFLLLILAIIAFGGSGGENVVPENVNNTAPVVEETNTPDFKPHQPKVIFDEPETTDEIKEEKKVEPTIEPLEITSIKLPETEFAIYQEISFGIKIKGGVKPYLWSISEGSLPDGLIFENGVIKGVIRDSGEFSFTIFVIDANRNIKTQRYSMSVYSEFQLGSEIPRKMILNEEYSFKINAIGGKEPYSASELDNSLPNGVKFYHETLEVKGTSTEVGIFTLDLSLTDAIGQEQTWSHKWFVDDPEPIIEKPKDDKDDKELEKPDDKIENPEKEPEKPSLSQTQIRLLLMKYRNEASQLLRAKKYQEAIDVFAKILELDDQDSNAYYNSACAYSLMKNKDKAIEYLEKAIRAGFRDLNHILEDKDFDYIKRDKRFRKLTKNQDVINQLSMNALKDRVAKEFPADQGFLKTIDHENRLVYATNLGDSKDDSREILNMLRSRIENYAKAQWRQLFKKKPKYYITVVIPKKQWFDLYKRRKGFPAMVGGWYNPADKFLIAGTMGHTLTHEFTHAMHFADMEGRKGQKNMHIWFTEGLATCFEDCKLPERSTQKPEPIYNNRVKTMVTVLENPNYRSRLYWNWRKFFSQDRRIFMSRGRVGVSYSMSRCITLWLYRTKRLKKYYELYMDSCDNGTPDGKNGITAMEKLFGMKLEKIEDMWLKWIIVQKYEDPKAYIGIEISSKPSNMGMGVVISEVKKDSSAEDAGLQVGDIIVTFNRMAIDVVSHLAVAITECKIGQKVDCVIIRNGKPVELKVKLKRRPK